METLATILFFVFVITSLIVGINMCLRVKYDNIAFRSKQNSHWYFYGHNILDGDGKATNEWLFYTADKLEITDEGFITILRNSIENSGNYDYQNDLIMIDDIGYSYTLESITRPVVKIDN